MLVDARVSSDEHQLLPIESELAIEPVLALLQDVRTVLLGSWSFFYARVIRWRSKNRHSEWLG
jgi:hypothetical protein